jgi:hypothetical protein
MTRRLLVLLALAASLALAACGNAEQENETYQSENAQVAETEGIYVTVDHLKYQVQMSKQLNPALPGDRPYLTGVKSKLDRDEEWFAVFVLVQNYADHAIQSAGDFEIADTQENTYVPVPIPDENDWAYQPANLQPNETLPGSDDPARERFPNGGMLLFKVKRFSLDNRPLELTIRGLEDRAIVNLDV